jgi:hypothetical protein
MQLTSKRAVALTVLLCLSGMIGALVARLEEARGFKVSNKLSVK